MTILSLVLSVESVENKFWACFAILLSQENRNECQENKRIEKIALLSLVLNVSLESGLGYLAQPV